MIGDSYHQNVIASDYVSRLNWQVSSWLWLYVDVDESQVPILDANDVRDEVDLLATVPDTHRDDAATVRSELVRCRQHVRCRRARHLAG